MKSHKFLTALLVLGLGSTLILTGCAPKQDGEMEKSDENSAMMESDSMMKDDSMEKENDAMMEKEEGEAMMEKEDDAMEKENDAMMKMDAEVKVETGN